MKLKRWLKTRLWWYNAIVEYDDGKQQAIFYGSMKPVIGEECPGAATPNKIVRMTRRLAPNFSGSVLEDGPCRRPKKQQ